MTIAHLIAGYDRQSDRLVAEHRITDAILDEIRHVVDIPDTDRDAVGSYPLDAAVARALADKLSGLRDVDAYDWFLEPAAED